MAIAFVMTACSSDDNNIEKAEPDQGVKIIPYSVTVNGETSTRATVDGDLKTLYFAAGDKLYISGTNISGVMDIQTGAGTASATFSGSLTYTGGGTPASDLTLNATLVSAQQTDGVEVTIAANKTVTVNYGTALCADVNTAVQKYSLLTGTSTYGSKSFSLTQQTAFLNFAITLNDGTSSGDNVTVTVANVGGSDRTGSIKAITEDEKVKVKFVAPVATQTLANANVTVGSNAAVAFGESKVLAAKVYNVNRKIVNLSAVTAYEAQDGDILTGTGGNDSHITIADKATVTLNSINITTIKNDDSHKWSGLTCNGDATFILKGMNYVNQGNEDWPAIAGADNKTIVIYSDGTLVVDGRKGPYGAAGINLGTDGDLIINGGTITVNGGTYCAAIQGNGSNSDITITGGVVSAYGGGSSVPGIGTGNVGTCGKIEISGGSVTASGGQYAAGIGGGNWSLHGNIIITTGVTMVKASKGSDARHCVGNGYNPKGGCGTVTIGGNLYWDGTNYQNGGETYLTNSPLIYPTP